MWIVKLALRRPYTFVVMALLIMLMGVVSIFRTPTDIFPEINIPVVSVIWTYRGMDTREMDARITTYSEYAISSNVNGIRNLESQTVNGVAVIRVYFHPNVRIEEAISQVTAVCQAIRSVMPPSVQPPIILRFNASSVPILQIALSSDTLSESQVYDYGLYELRRQLAVVQGITLPTPYGGMERQIMVDLDPEALQARGLSPRDVTEAINAHNLALPTGTARIGDQQYPVSLNSAPPSAEAFNDLPVKQVNGSMVYLRDVAHVRDGYQSQTTVVRRDGKRGALVSILKGGGASTMEIVQRVKALLPTLRASAPKGMQIELLGDQSLFVAASIRGVIQESIIAACLTAAMILLFLGSWRSTLIIAASIPLSILVSIIALSALGHTINVMTLGGLALAVGVLVDDATVEIENVHRNLALGKPLRQAILDGAQQIAGPTFVSTTTICIVFVPVVFLEGPAQFLFTPLALAVVFAMAASYLLWRTLVPLMVRYLLPAELHHHAGLEGASPSTGPSASVDFGLFRWIHTQFLHGFEALRSVYADALTWALSHRREVLGIFLVVIASGAALIPFVGRDFFPTVDTGTIRLHVRAPAGVRLEQSAQYFGQVEDEIRRVIPAEELDVMIDNIGLPNRTYTMAFGDSATTGMADGEILVSLKKGHGRHGTGEYIRQLREVLPTKFPQLTFYLQPADIVSQILNFGLPAPIDVQVIGYNRDGNEKIAREIAAKIARIPGATDVHVHQVTDVPELHLQVDRSRVAELGLTQRDVADNVLVSLSGSGQVLPNYWVDPQTGISYLVEARTPQHRLDSVESIGTIPIASPKQQEPQLLSNLASVERRASAEMVNHSNIQPTFDVYANVQGRDLGGVSEEVERIVREYQAKLPPGNQIMLRGQVESMNSAFLRLGLGLIFAAILVYLLMVVNFQSWLDPFVILMALPGAFTGIVWMLFATQTTFSVPALMGALMCIGVATANSILVVTFANEQRAEGMNALEAAHSAGDTRLRPVIMTAAAMILGMLPMAIGHGEGGEQNAPLGRAVIGGLLLATFATLFFVPVVYSVLRRKDPQPLEELDHEDAPVRPSGSPALIAGVAATQAMAVKE